MNQPPLSNPALQAEFEKLVEAHINPAVDPNQYRQAVELLRDRVKIEQEKTDQLFEFIGQLLDGLSARSRAKSDGRPEDWKLEELASWLRRVDR